MNVKRLFSSNNDVLYIANNHDSYRIFEVSICGLISLLQRSFILDICQSYHIDQDSTLTAMDMITKLEIIFGFETYKLSLNACTTHNGHQSILSKQYYDWVYDEINKEIQKIEKDAKKDKDESKINNKNILSSSSLSSSSLDTLDIMRYSACFMASYHYWDEAGMCLLLEFFTEWCSISILKVIPSEVINTIDILSCSNIDWSSAARGQNIIMLSTVLIERLNQAEKINKKKTSRK